MRGKRWAKLCLLGLFLLCMSCQVFAAEGKGRATQQVISWQGKEILVKTMGCSHNIDERCQPVGIVWLTIPEEAEGQWVYFQLREKETGTPSMPDGLPEGSRFLQTEELGAVFGVPVKAGENEIRITGYLPRQDAGKEWGLFLLGGQWWEENYFSGMEAQQLNPSFFYGYLEETLQAYSMFQTEGEIRFPLGKEEMVVNGVSQTVPGISYVSPSGHAMVQLRAVLEALPFWKDPVILWNEEAQEVTVLFDKFTMVFSVGQSQVQRAGGTFDLPEDVARKNGSVYVPLEALRLMDVSAMDRAWDGKTREAVLAYHW